MTEYGTIYRYEVPVSDEPCTIDLWGDPLAVGCRNWDRVEFWAMSYTFPPDILNRPTPRTFRVIGTGHPIPGNFKKHWGTAVAPGGKLVWHLVEVVA